MMKYDALDLVEYYMWQHLPKKYYQYNEFVWDDIIVKSLPSIGTYCKVIVRSPYKELGVVFVSSRGKASFVGFEPIPTDYKNLMEVSRENSSMGTIASIIARSRQQNSWASPRPPPTPSTTSPAPSLLRRTART
jgi:hypothetical protein